MLDRCSDNDYTKTNLITPKPTEQDDELINYTCNLDMENWIPIY
jgi:hypothetical protein